MNKPSIVTIIIIICILIVGLYALGEVNYFSSKISIEKNIESPKIIIPTIGLEEKINNVSLSQGVLHEPTSYTPTKGEALIYGHRTLQGSPFLRLNEVSNGDEIVLEWPGIGELNYTVINSTVVPATYELIPEEGKDNVYLITCDPIGSTENRLIIEGKLTDKNPINEQILMNNPQEHYSWILSAVFLIVGLILSYFYPKDNRIYITATILLVSAVLFYFCISPVPSQIIMDKIIFLNGGL